ncbi:hypothetical protein [Methylomagnum sp.]
MKYLLYFLVLANLVFFAWEIGFRQDKNTESSYQELVIPSGVERIALTSELGKAPDADEVPEGEVVDPGMAGEDIPAPESKPKPPPKPTDCYQIGPAQTRAEADNLLDLLKSQTPDANIVTLSGDVPEGWWILYPKAINLDVARENRRALAGKGVVDAWLFEKGPLQGALSLGLYKTKEEAESARKPFMDKNIVTEIAPRLVRGQVFWLKIPWHRPALELEEIVQVLNSQDSSLHIPAPMVCD